MDSPTGVSMHTGKYRCFLPAFHRMCRTFLFAVRNRVGYNGVEENGVPRKPLIIILISLCFFISPVFILLQASILTLTPVIGPYNIFSKLSPHDVFILCLYPLCAAAVFSVRRWGWYVFLAASVYLVAANIITFALRPHYHVLSLIIYNLILTVAAGIFFRRDVIAPYFNPPLRWWEQPKRFGVDMFFEITGLDGAVRAEIADISRTGVFLVCRRDLPLEREHEMVFHVFGRKIALHARTVRRDVKHGETGFGLKFVRTGSGEQAALQGLLLDLRRAGFLDRNRARASRRDGPGVRKTAPRFRFATRAAIVRDGQSRPCLLLDLSRTGCLLDPEGNEEAECSERFRLSLRCGGHETLVECEPRWHGVLDGRNVCGAFFVFDHPRSARRVRRIVNRFRKAGAAGRNRLAHRLPAERLEEYALHSPYRLVHAVKSKLKRQ